MLAPVRRLRRQEWWRELTASQLFVGSFLVLVALGTLGFKTLPGLYVGPELSWLDALFTATSAVCVTGLIVVDTATYFTTWGQAYILLLIQLGAWASSRLPASSSRRWGCACRCARSRWRAARPT